MYFIIFFIFKKSRVRKEKLTTVVYAQTDYELKISRLESNNITLQERISILQEQLKDLQNKSLFESKKSSEEQRLLHEEMNALKSKVYLLFHFIILNEFVN